MRRTAKHPFGAIKAWTGATHFLTRALQRVGTEMRLQVLAYNLKRAIAIKGVGPLISAVRAWHAAPPVPLRSAAIYTGTNPAGNSNRVPTQRRSNPAALRTGSESLLPPGHTAPLSR